MNERGREVLVKAALDGVPQAFGEYFDGEARCALGALYAAAHLSSEYAHEQFGLTLKPMACPECGLKRTDETHLIVHLNDDHRFDFLTIARKLA